MIQKKVLLSQIKVGEEMTLLRWGTKKLFSATAEIDDGANESIFIRIEQGEKIVDGYYVVQVENDLNVYFKTDYTPQIPHSDLQEDFEDLVDDLETDEIIISNDTNYAPYRRDTQGMGFDDRDEEK